MSELSFYRLASVSVWDLIGTQAEAILHNLTTNEIKNLSVNEGCESFVTDVRGKTLGHGFVFRTQDGFRLIGAHGQSDGLAAHADRYTIREDATPTIRDTQFVAFVVSANQVSELLVAMGAEFPPAQQAKQCKQSVCVDAINCIAYQVDWIGDNTCVLLVGESFAHALEQALAKKGFAACDEAAFHDQRIAAGYPWYGVDINEKNLPQEADRNAQTISFTKGCYLGQETVARLDALGQVQKQLVLWSIKDCVPPVGSELAADGKTVGRLTSVSKVAGGGAMAIGMARRSHFDPGAVATGETPSGEAFEAVVQPSQTD